MHLHVSWYPWYLVYIWMYCSLYDNWYTYGCIIVSMTTDMHMDVLSSLWKLIYIWMYCSLHENWYTYWCTVVSMKTDIHMDVLSSLWKLIYIWMYCSLYRNWFTYGFLLVSMVTDICINVTRSPWYAGLQKSMCIDVYCILCACQRFLKSHLTSNQQPVNLTRHVDGHVVYSIFSRIHYSLYLDLYTMSRLVHYV